jgi:DNA polymerase III subunit alpha
LLLNCHTSFSSRYGVLTPEYVLLTTKQFGYSTIAITDINATSAIIDAYRLSKENDMRLIAGIDFRNDITPCYIGLAKNNKGYYELNTHLSFHLHHQKPFESQAPSTFLNTYVIYHFQSYKGWKLEPHEYIGISINDFIKLSNSPYKSLTKKMVILQSLTFLNKKQFNIHRLLRSIDKNCLLSKLDAKDQASEKALLLSETELIQAFINLPEIILNTKHILESCFIDFEFDKFANKNLNHYTDSPSSDIALIKQLCNNGLNYRFKKPDKKIQERIDKEIEIIEKMKFASYFLINWDIVSYAQQQNYYYIGRGSGANSIVAYLLNITDVDPLELDLYFERFINPYRSNPPDFDIDFSWTDRDDITHYIFDKYGHERTALVGSYNTFQHDATIRELGKVFGLPQSEIDRLQDKKNTHEKDELGKLVLKYSEYIKGLPNHLSIHASGILISHEPIHNYTATFMPNKGYPTTQFSMLEAEDIGLYKFDILSQRGLAKIKDALQIISEQTTDTIDIHDLHRFKNDALVKEHLSNGDCIGCFYIESPAMRMLLAKLKADDYLRLVAASSIIRPGVSKSGMMREYILRFRDEARREKAKKAIPELYELLHETYGVMVYQEDVIKVAHYFAGLSLAEADYLRRGMSWKFKQRNEFFKVRDNFFNNCLQKKYALKTIEDIWLQIESFANYAFSKGHSASYAVESYQALFLKAHYPLPYMVATLNNGGGFYRIESYINEARKHGAIIHAPCVNNSTILCSLNEKNIYLGLGMIANFERGNSEIILKERSLNGNYTSFQNFVERTRLSLEQTILLIRIGAFNFCDKNKKELLWEAHLSIREQLQTKTLELFETENEQLILPELLQSPIDDAFDEIELLGFTLGSPFELIQELPKNTIKAHELKQYLNQTISIIGYLINVKSTYTATKERMYFGTFVDENGLWIDTVHFPNVAKNFPFKGHGCYLIKGQVNEEFDYFSIIASELHHLPVKARYD